MTEPEMAERLERMAKYAQNRNSWQVACTLLTAAALLCAVPTQEEWQEVIDYISSPRAKRHSRRLLRLER